MYYRSFFYPDCTWKEITDKKKVSGDIRMRKLIICDSCGAQFDSDGAKCPYCGTMNYAGAEKEYFDKLDEIREDVEELSAVPMQEAKAELKKQGSFVKKVAIGFCLLVIVFWIVSFLQEKIYERDNKADFLWEQTNFPIMDEMYVSGKYEELVEFYQQAEQEDRTVYMWEHAEFVRAYGYIQSYYADLDYLETLEEAEKREIEVWEYSLYLWRQWKVLSYRFSVDLSEDEKAYFEKDFLSAEQSLRNNWDYDEETYQKFYKRISGTNTFGVTFDECDAYIEEWKEKMEGKE